MPRPRPWTDAETTQLKQLHAAGGTVTSIAKDLGRSRSTVSGVAKRLGLQWSKREQTKAATAARVADAKARRAKLSLDLLGDIEQLRAQLFAPTLVYNFGGKDNTYNEHQIDKPPIADQYRLAQAASTLIDRHLRLVDHDASDGITQVTSMLDRLFTMMGVAGPEGEQ